MAPLVDFCIPQPVSLTTSQCNATRWCPGSSGVLRLDRSFHESSSQAAKIQPRTKRTKRTVRTAFVAACGFEWHARLCSDTKDPLSYKRGSPGGDDSSQRCYCKTCVVARAALITERNRRTGSSESWVTSMCVQRHHNGSNC